MSSKNLINNTNIISIDERIHVLCTNEAINGKEFAKLVGITAQYLTDFRTGRIKIKNPRNFWKGVRAKFPQWESYLRGETDTPPERDASLGQSYLSLAEAVQGGKSLTALTRVSINELLFKAGGILKSKTVYGSALKSNIEAFHQAITHEEALESAHKRIDELEKQILDIKKRLPAVGE